MRAYRRSSLVEKIKGIVYITFILGGMLAFAVVLTLSYYTWALIIWGIVAFTLIMTMAIVRIAECRVLSYRNYKDYMKNEKYYIKNTAVENFAVFKVNLTLLICRSDRGDINLITDEWQKRCIKLFWKFAENKRKRIAMRRIMRVRS